jgi:hypothetical protein
MGNQGNMAGIQCRTDEDALLRRILEGTATETGERFFRALVENVGRALDVRGAWVTEYLEESRALRSLAFWLDGVIHGRPGFSVCTLSMGRRAGCPTDRRGSPRP